jgi:hypothetical protein|tara:strand:- start:370 stop:642 length:273 start_codon:yes stop_codon:yes gene_type:complete
MKVKLSVHGSNFDDNQIVNANKNLYATIEGSNVLTIKDLNSENVYHFDLKSTCFTESDLLIEGILADDKGILGRCLFYVEELDKYAGYKH